MGQYFKVINKTKKEFINPHTFGNGLKLWEIVASGKGVMQGLGLLLAEGHIEYNKKYEPIPSTIIGRWQGDSIAIVGDYAKSGLYDMCEDEDGKAKEGWKDISIPTYKTLLKDTWIGSRKKQELLKDGTQWMFGDEKKIMEELFPKECIEGELLRKQRESKEIEYTDFKNSLTQDEILDLQEKAQGISKMINKAVGKFKKEQSEE